MDNGLEPARSIIEMIGGEAKVAEITGSGLSTPYGWQKPTKQGGTGGFIPRWHHKKILDFAAQNGLPLSAADFYATMSEAS
jgi:hypothetical protein